jgi:formate-dependent nitrite reductase membrane component NrfD
MAKGSFVKGGSTQPTQSQKFSTLYICFCIGYYFVVSLSLTFLNKLVLFKFNCPLFMTWLQFIVALFCLKVLGYAGRFFPSIPSHIGVLEYSFSYETFKKTLSLGISYVSMYVPILSELRC